MSDAPPAPAAGTPEQNEIARLTRVLEMHLADERLLSWVGTSGDRMGAVMAVMVGKRVSLRRAIEIVAAIKPEIPATSVAQIFDEDEADEPEGVGAGAPWDEETDNV
ncbi:hypothetical protein [Humibacter sp.]|uniref:hypothetical protein n=1 Tax=Humibacter sp. TaxID=1940291 RepID=UPI003F80417E